MHFMIHQCIVFLHLFLFAAALMIVIKQDYLFFIKGILNKKDLKNSSEVLSWLLLGLWGSGAILVYQSVDGSIEELLLNCKIMAKITVMLVLTINGFILHFFGFKHIEKPNKYSSIILSIIGVISLVSWFFASFIGAARVAAPHLSYDDFMLCYLIALLVGFCISFSMLGRIKTILKNNCSC